MCNCNCNSMFSIIYKDSSVCVLCQLKVSETKMYQVKAKNGASPLDLQAELKDFIQNSKNKGPISAIIHLEKRYPDQIETILDENAILNYYEQKLNIFG